MESPRRVSDTVHNIDVTNYVFPWKDGQPVYVNGGGPDLFIPIFSTEAKLRHAMAVFGVAYEAVKQIARPRAFFSGFPPYIDEGVRLRFMIDPWLTERGTACFKEITPLFWDD